ncbi:MAG TPA: SDR family NAD(P)-dependent oxidoreductase, partial [Gemmatimonadales bacterium]|nr:SDR family NAD(P)-dependent oxidoreductase [Gemmatimonadales bacterium]
MHDEIAVVTGALGKLGPVWMEALLEAGARVVGIDLPGQAVRPRVESLRAQWPADALLLLEADVCERDSLEKALGACREAVGMPSILVNNAGIDQPPTGTTEAHTIHTIPIDSWRRILD